MSAFGAQASPFASVNKSPFGQPANNSASSLFGQPQNQSQQPQNQQPQSNLFGGSILGSQTQNQPQTSAFGSALGQPQNQQTSAFGSALGQPQNQQTSAFGSTLGQPQNQQTNAFGGSMMNKPQNQQPSVFGSLLGQPQSQPQNNAFGGSLLNRPQNQNQQQPQQQYGTSSFLNASQAPQRSSVIWEPGRETTINKPVSVQFENIFNKWHPQHPNTVFKYYFYNKVDQSAVPFFQPGPGEDPREWEQAVHDKPGPGYMPALATGFNAVAGRLQMQMQVLAKYRQALHSINSSLDAILSKHDLQTSVRALNARRKHALLRQRCLALASKVQVLRNRGYALDKEEDELKTKLETLDRRMTDPALSARTEELWSRLLLLRGYADHLENEVNRRGAEAQEGLGEEAEAKAKKILEDYDKQLQTLKAQVDAIKKDYDEWQAEANPPSKK
ncbi:nucleoporin complex subunit 54-domain-containing protein [Whalleya microplaca]|nr:nucleoporin complex subunit 54-domain-containing protein [Whalleya microplaca]